MGRTNTGGSGGIDTSDATATVNDIALDKTAYVNGSKITGTANITTLNLFSQTTQPTTYDGIWVDTSSTVNKIAQVDDFLSEWNKSYINTLPFATVSDACVKYDNKIIMIGGWTGSVTISNVYIYDIHTNTWSTGASMPVINRNFAFGIYNGKVYCAGGSTNASNISGYNSLYIYDIENNTWSTGASMPAARALTNGTIYNGKLYVAGGWVGGTTTPSNVLYIYDIENNTWSTGASMPSARAMGCVTATNGYLYYIGGILNDSATSYSNNYIYNIANNTWSTGLSIPSPRLGSFVVPYNNKLYLIGGWTNNLTPVSTNYIYGISNNTWTLGNPVPNAVYLSLVSDETNNLIYGMGFNGIGYIYLPDGVQTQLYDNDTVIIQTIPSTINQPYKTTLIESGSFVGGYLQYFTDAIINGVNADIYYGDGSQWIKIRSAV